jgi:hypothetical protein
MGQEPDAVQSVYDVLRGQAPIDRVHAAFVGAAKEPLRSVASPSSSEWNENACGRASELCGHALDRGSGRSAAAGGRQERDRRGRNRRRAAPQRPACPSSACPPQCDRTRESRQRGPINARLNQQNLPKPDFALAISTSGVDAAAHACRDPVLSVFKLIERRLHRPAAWPEARFEEPSAALLAMNGAVEADEDGDQLRIHRHQQSVPVVAAGHHANRVERVVVLL